MGNRAEYFYGNFHRSFNNYRCSKGLDFMADTAFEPIGHNIKCSSPNLNDIFNISAGF